jgi:hypothetical protein
MKHIVSANGAMISGLITRLEPSPLVCICLYTHIQNDAILAFSKPKVFSGFLYLICLNRALEF